MAPMKTCYTVPLCSWRQSKKGSFVIFSGNISCVNLSNIVRQEEKDGNVNFRQWSNVMSKTKKEKFGPAKVFGRKWGKQGVDKDCWHRHSHVKAQLSLGEAQRDNKVFLESKCEYWQCVQKISTVAFSPMVFTAWRLFPSQKLPLPSLAKPASFFSCV